MHPRLPPSSLTIPTSCMHAATHYIMMGMWGGEPHMTRTVLGLLDLVPAMPLVTLQHVHVTVHAPINDMLGVCEHCSHCL